MRESSDGGARLGRLRAASVRRSRAAFFLVVLAAAAGAAGEAFAVSEPASPASSPAGAADDAEAQAFLTVDQAPRAVFPDAEVLERRDVAVTPELRAAVQSRLGDAAVSVWEPTWVAWQVKQAGTVVGYAVVVEEVGKHRPITSVVGVGADGRVKDLAVMVYREAYGGDVRQRRFLAQYAGVGSADALAARIRNVAGATLSVEAMNRSVRKALAIVDVLWLHPAAGAAGAADGGGAGPTR